MQRFIRDYPQFRNVFGFSEFNAVQLGCYDQLMTASGNMLVTAPTSSGKTVIFQLALIKEASLSTLKCLYIAPIKSLCHEKYSSWSKKFSKSFKVLELTSDTLESQQFDLNNVNILVATPQKIDFLSRKNLSYLSKINLFLIDEIHMLNLEERGGILEALISRIMSLNSPRILAVSATIPNIHEVAEWLKVSKTNTFIFGKQYRPVPLNKVVLGFKSSNNPFLFEKTLNYKLLEVLRNYNAQKSSLVFCQTQKGTEAACQQLISDMKERQYIDNDQCLLHLVQASKSISNSFLQVIIPQGIGFHNASLSLNDRTLIEKLFLQRKLKVLCTTSTLAMGINLPARLVVIKSTQCYRGAGKGYQQYTQIQLEQMMGRAGRPPFDESGTVVIMTEKKNYDKYLHAQKLQTLQSHINERLCQHINAQICMKSISCFQDVLNYFKNSFCYIRMKKSPLLYGIKGNIDEDVQNRCYQALDKLKKAELISYTNQNKIIVARPLGINIMKNSIQIDTITKILQEITNIQGEKQFLTLLCTSQEVKKFRNRLDQRKALKQLSQKVKYGFKGTISTPEKKAFILLQAEMDGIHIQNWEMRKQVKQIGYFMRRLTYCIKAATYEKKCYWGYFWSSLYHKFWTAKFSHRNEQMIVRQFPELNQKWKALSMRGFKNISHIMENSQMIDCLCQKSSKFNQKIMDKLLNIKQCITVKYQNCQNRGLLEVKFIGRFDQNFKYVTVLVGNELNEIFAVRSLGVQCKQTKFYIPKKKHYLVFIKENYIGFDEFFIIRENGQIQIFSPQSIQNKQQKQIKKERKSSEYRQQNILRKNQNQKSKSHQISNRKEEVQSQASSLFKNQNNNKLITKKNGKISFRQSRKKAPQLLTNQEDEQISEKQQTMKKNYIPLNKYKCWRPGFPAFNQDEDNRETISRKLLIEEESKSKNQFTLPKQPIYSKKKKTMQPVSDAYQYFYNLFQ